MTVNFKRLYEDSILPSYGNNDSSNAGLDLYAHYGCVIPVGESAIFGTGIAWEPPNDHKYFMEVKSRSGLAFNHGVEASGAGVIDSTFQGEIKVKLYNNGQKPYRVNRGDRIAQGIIFELPVVEVKEVAELSDSTRGANGFGSSGK